MADYKETSLDYLSVDGYAVFTSNERKWVNKIQKLKEAHPDDVVITAHPEGNDGYIVARVPKNWFKLTPPRKINYTEERRAAFSERMRALRKNECRHE